MDPFFSLLLHEQQTAQLDDLLRWPFDHAGDDCGDGDCPFELARSPTPSPAAAAERTRRGGDGGAESSGGFRHMMRERQRRERLSQGYADLYAMLPSASKVDKVSVVEGAAEYLKELQQRRERLRRRNRELKLTATTMASGSHHTIEEAESPVATTAAAINVSVEDYSSSSVDLVMAALRCLKKMELRTAAFGTAFSGQDLSVQVLLDGDQKNAAKEVERAMKSVLCFNRITG